MVLGLSYEWLEYGGEVACCVVAWRSSGGDDWSERSEWLVYFGLAE